MAVNFVMFFVSVLVLSGRVESKLGQEEQRALLRFINGTKHPNRVRWNDSVSVCDWVGVMCADRSFVFSVRLPGARLVGSILPNTLGRLQQLRVLSLRFNGLSGKIPSDFSNLTLLRSLYLQSNNFSGGFPESVTRLGKRLRRLDLSSNNFSGPIPLTVDNLTNLTDLFLENNNFSGNLPSINLVYLRHFNVSNNNLNGQIPKGLAKFPAEAFIGNPDLCGAPLPSCFRSSAISPPPPSPSPIPPPPSPSLTPPLPSPPSPSLTPPLPSPPSPSLTPPLPSPSLTPPLPSPPSPSLTPPLPSPSLTPLPAEHEGNSNKPPTGAIFAIAVGSAVVALLLLLFLILCLRRQRRQPPEQQKTPIVPRPVATEEGTSSSKDGITCGSAEAERNKLVFYEGAVYSFELEDLLRASTEVLE